MLTVILKRLNIILVKVYKDNVLLKRKSKRSHYHINVILIITQKQPLILNKFGYSSVLDSNESFTY